MKYLKVLLVAFSAIALSANAQNSKEAPGTDTNQPNEALAKELANPLANLIQVPFQYNYYQNAGPDKKDTVQAVLFQPVIPLAVNKDYNYIIRPVVTLETIGNGSGGSQSGMGPTMVETFFSPNTNSDFLWGAGPVLQIPSSAYQYGSKQWGAGVSAVAMYRPGHWTMGLLGYQTFNIGGSSLGGTANNSYLQPFIAFTAKTATTVTLMAQGSFNNDAKTSSVPIYLTVSQLFRVDKLPVQFSIGPAYYAASAPNGPSGWGGRASISFVLPKSMF